jgi:hypothetical protein
MKMKLPEGWREVHPGLYERVDTPREPNLSRDSLEELVRASGGSPAFRKLVERAHEKPESQQASR